MSFDVSLVLPPCDHCKRGDEQVASVNLTHNVNPIVDRCFVEAGGPVAKSGAPTPKHAAWAWWRLSGWTAQDAIPVLERALETIDRTDLAEVFRGMEPSNGWGKTADVEEVMLGLLTACRQNPTAIIRVDG